MRALETEQVQRPWGRKEFAALEDEQEGASTAELQEEKADEGGGVTAARSRGLLGRGQILGFSSK